MRKTDIPIWDEPGSGLISKTALKWPAEPKALPSAKDDRRPVSERLAEVERQEALSVALSQPHRIEALYDSDGGFVPPDDPRRATALGRFCLRQRVKRELFNAGQSYGETVRLAKIAQGLSANGGWMPGTDGYSTITEEQLEARKDLALQRLAKANQILREAVFQSIHSRIINAMVGLCYDDRDPAPNDGGLLKLGLLKLAIADGSLRANGNG